MRHDSSHRGQGSWGKGDVSSSSHPKQRTVLLYQILTYWPTFWQIHYWFGDPGDPSVTFSIERLRHMNLLLGNVKNYLRLTTKCTRAAPKVMSPILLCWSTTSGESWWYGSRGPTFSPMLHSMLLLCDRWQQRGSLTEWHLAWKYIWSNMQMSHHEMKRILISSSIEISGLQPGNCVHSWILASLSWKWCSQHWNIEKFAPGESHRCSHKE